MNAALFSADSTKFFSGLTANNNKQWFEAHRQEYEEHILMPAMRFVEVIGSALKSSVAPNLTAIPRVDKSIFRLHRDIRFSKEKSPFKTHLGIFMWEGEGKKLECPGFYFQLSAEQFMIAGGLHIFSPELLERYREAVIDDKIGPALPESVKAVLNREPSFRLQEKKYKKVPRGYNSAHPLADWLLYDGIAVMAEEPVSDKLFSADFTDEVIRKFGALKPLHSWLLKMKQS